MTIIIATDIPDIRRVILAPNINRLSSSLPKWSVPRGNSAEGARSRACRFNSVGSCKGSNGASTAIRTVPNTMTNPKAVPWSRRKVFKIASRRPDRRDIPSNRRSSALDCLSIKVQPTRLGWLIIKMEPGIQKSIGNVHRQVHK